MHKSENLIKDLISHGCDMSKCDSKLIQAVIREYFCQIHKDAVKDTEIAHQKKSYVEPNFYD